MREKKIAYLIPTYNGGDLLLETVASAAQANLAIDSYELVVIDNASTDGSIVRLPTHDSHGAPIHIVRNSENLGRVQNWNRAVEVAREMGFGYATYLMVGDLVFTNAILELKLKMDRADSAFGMASFRFVDEDRRFLRFGRQLRWQVGNSGISPRDLIARSTARGAQIIGLLQANLYRLDGTPPLRFDPANPSMTDHDATYRFLIAAGKPVVYLDKPILDWRQRTGRFHASMDVIENARRETDLVSTVCHLVDVKPDWPRVNATLLMRGSFHAMEGAGSMFAKMGKLRRFIAYFRTRRGGTSWPWLLRLISGQILLGSPYVVGKK